MLPLLSYPLGVSGGDIGGFAVFAKMPAGTWTPLAG